MLKSLRLFMAVLYMSMSLGLVALVPQPASAADCPGGVKVSEALDQNNNPNDNCVGDADHNPIFAFLRIVIRFATGILGLVLVLMIVIAGLQYVISNGAPDKTKSAKERLEHAATGLVLFLLMVSILQVILPPDVRVFN